MNLRPYQERARDRIHKALEEHGSTLLVFATALGKTVVFSKVAEDFMDRGKVMILAHREELIFQAQEKLMLTTGYQADIEMAEHHHEFSGIWDAKCIVSTIQTQISGMRGKGRMTKFNPNDFSLIIIDEAHHCAAASYRKVIDYYRQNPNIKILGVTATPDRADEKALGQIFESVADEYDIKDGIKDGWLVPIHAQLVHVDGLDYSSIRTTAGDLNGADLAAVLEVEEMCHRIASPAIELVGPRKALVFAASLVQAERLCEIFNRHIPACARWVHGGTPKDERRWLFRDYALGRFQYLVNVGVATEGFDDPGIQVIILARPTKSRALYAQMVGRGTRTLPDLFVDSDEPQARKQAIAQSAKPFVEVVDFVGNSGKHKLVTTADILGGDYDEAIVERAQKNMEAKGKGDPITELEEAERELLKEQKQREDAARRNKIVARALYSTAKVNPFDVLDVMPCRERGWNQGRTPSEKQVAFLESQGVDTKGLSFTHASQLIDNIIKRRKEAKCSYKQAKLLRKYHFDPTDWTFEKASNVITAIQQNGWQVGKDVFQVARTG